jgi:hypothetical protein
VIHQEAIKRRKRRSGRFSEQRINEWKDACDRCQRNQYSHDKQDENEGNHPPPPLPYKAEQFTGDAHIILDILKKFHCFLKIDTFTENIGEGACMSTLFLMDLSISRS